jgi:hypothetical protein
MILYSPITRDPAEQSFLARNHLLNQRFRQCVVRNILLKFGDEMRIAIDCVKNNGIPHRESDSQGLFDLAFGGLRACCLQERPGKVQEGLRYLPVWKWSSMFLPHHSNVLSGAIRSAAQGRLLSFGIISDTYE